VEPELKKEYIDNGLLRLEWRDFPYLGEESRRAAVAARAAQEQDKF
jgi:protein-disulfide isomerase